MRYYTFLNYSFSSKSSFSGVCTRFNLSEGKGQSAIEYLMTYGWMLLVIAIVGGTIFSVVRGQGVQEVAGFSSGGVSVDDAGITSGDDLGLVLRNIDPEQVTIDHITVRNGEREVYWQRGQSSIGIGSTESLTVKGVSSGGGSNNLDVIINYDSGSLDNLKASGTLSGRMDLVAGKPVELEAPKEGGEWTWVDGSSYFGTDYGDEEGFFVMKYEARNNSGVFSGQGGQPWTNITFNDALDECQDLSNSDYDISLITNTQWMTIARQVETQSQNWVDEDFGSSRYNDKGLVRGWSANNASDDWENTDFAPDSTRLNLYNVGKNEGGSDGPGLYRRTYLLKSGGVIWDFSANAKEFVDLKGDGTTISEANISSDSSSGDPSYGFVEADQDYIAPWAFKDAEDVRYEIGAVNEDYGQEQGLGAYFDSSSTGRVARRGGAFNDEYRAGPYAIGTRLNDSEPQSGTGFRCTAIHK